MPGEVDTFDVVIVGGGLSGSIIAKQLARAGIRVLMLEAGGNNADQGTTLAGYYKYLSAFYTAYDKLPNSPYPVQASEVPSKVFPGQMAHYARHPDVLDLKVLGAEDGAEEQYMLQRGPEPYRSSYARVLGGTMMHWQGSCFRLLPNDFQVFSKYGRGRDWPLSYDDLVEDYERAEREIGVAGNVEDQKDHGTYFTDGYVYPMHEIPPSYLDQVVKTKLDGMSIDGIAGFSGKLAVRSVPQGRNGVPNPEYRDTYGDKADLLPPVGAVRHREFGQRCQGNASCVPICPVQAKYNPIKTLIPLLHGASLQKFFTLRSNAVASKILVDRDAGAVTGIEYYSYSKSEPPVQRKAVAKIYVLAAHAVENAKLLLVSGIQTESGLVGKGLMDHPVLLTWGLMPEPVGSHRGPGLTSTLPALCDGDFRKDFAPFRIEIANWGWHWSSNTPFQTIQELVEQNVFGAALRSQVRDRSVREIQLQFLLEQLPDRNNRVTIAPEYVDDLGIPRPIVQYDYDAYLKRGIQQAQKTSKEIFHRLGVVDYTTDVRIEGAGHFGGTHVMGSAPNDSVVDSCQQCWDFPNLFITGAGSFPTMGSSNPSLTIAALAFRTARCVIDKLKPPASTQTSSADALPPNKELSRR